MAARTSYWDRLRSKAATIQNPRDAEYLFARLAKESPENAVLTCDEKILPAVNDAVIILNPNLKPVLEFLSLLGAEKLSHGAYKNKTMACFLTVYKSCGFMDTICDQLRTNCLPDPTCIAWFLLKLSSEREVREDSKAREAVRMLLNNDAAGAKQLASQLATMFEQITIPDETSEVSSASEAFAELTSLKAAKATMRPPGVRDHDNDKENFRDISITPTPSEIDCTEGPYLAHEGGPEFIINREGATLDKLFRLMREDMVGSLRQELHDECKKKPGEYTRLFRNPVFLGIDFKPEPHCIIRVAMTSKLIGRLRKMNIKEVQDFFENGPGRRVFGQDSLILLNSNDSRNEGRSSFTTTAVGVVVARRNIISDKREGKGGPWELQLGVSFLGQSLAAVIPSLQGLKYKKEGARLAQYAFNATTSFFAYEPVLRTLQEMDKVPLGSVLVHLNSPTLPQLAHAGKDIAYFSSELQAAVEKDESQRRALELIFKSQVALVQGPPGTGKTFIGVQMVKAMIEADQRCIDRDMTFQRLQILCLCYTNHALDSFLEALLDSGIPSSKFIRLGSSPKISKRLKERCLKELEESKFDRNESRVFACLKQRHTELEEEIKETQDSFDKSQWGRSMEWWSEISEFLEDEYFEMYVQLEVHQSSIKDMDFKAVGRKNKVIQPNYLWERWCEGQDKGILKNDTRTNADSNSLDIWALRMDARQTLKEQWNQEWMRPRHSQLASLMEDMRRNCQALNDLRQSSQSRVLRMATIIGCTTVSAAKLRTLLRDASPSVVLVEEAGEIFEAQILATVGNKCKQLIMIGDHKQLPPKAECFYLRKEAGNGFNVDVSLFERLVRASWPAEHGNSHGVPPFITLHVQHRMRPEISRLVRETMYPELIDHETTMRRQSVKGVARDVLFISHSKLEVQDDDAAALGSNSKVNLHEVRMVIGIAMHLLQQKGVSPEQLTILTPYLGQLAQIRKELASNKLNAILGDLDRGDLARFGIDESGASNSTKCQSVRAATIDNYQGEEADIIIISLVRSNKEGDIGFLSSPERVNVLLSRARRGMFIVGNIDTLTHCKSSRGRVLWQKIKQLLDDQGQVLDFFPVRCEKHKLVGQVRMSEDFDKLAPYGGCNLPCKGTMDCGHVCTLPCHSNETEVHSQYPCKVLVPDLCAYGHSSERECGGEVKCEVMASWACHRGHSMSGKCFQGRHMNCHVCRRFEALEREAERETEEMRQELQTCEANLEESRIMVQYEKKKMDLDKRIAATKEELKLTRAELESRVKLVTRDKLQPPIKPKKQNAKRDSELVKRNSGTDSKAFGVPDDSICLPTDLTGKQTDGSILAQSDQIGENEEDVLCTVSHDAQAAAEMEMCPQSSTSASMENMEDTLDEEDCDILTILDAYAKKGALHADTVLESILQNRGSQSAVPKCLTAMQFILHNELGPCDEEIPPILEHERSGFTTISDLICIFARFLSLAPKFPNQAKKIAKRFNLGAQKILHRFPTSWKAKLDQSMQETFQSGASPADAAPKSALEKWSRIVENDPKAPAVMYDLLKMTGIESVKEAMIVQYHRITLAKDQNDGTANSYNIRFEGNPGTGKTTVARHYGGFLRQLGVLPESSTFLETSGASLINKGVKHLEGLLEKARNTKGAVIFVDEAYQLMSDSVGKQVLDSIIPISESIVTEYGRIVWIFAGYSKDMEKLFAHNIGLPSRFPHRFHFKDYSDEELMEIFKALLKNKTESPKSSKGASASTSKIIIPQSAPRSVITPGSGSRLDNFGNQWKWNGNSWQDEFGNVTGYGPTDLGTAGNPLISPDGRSWTTSMTTTGSDVTWCSNDGIVQSFYPGKPQPSITSETEREIPFRCENEKWLRIAIRRLGRQRVRIGFGNARAVRVFFDQVRDRQADRISQERDRGSRPDIYLFKRQDLLGKLVDEKFLESSKAYQELQRLEGLIPVKESVRTLIQLVVQNAKREEREKPVLDVVLNRVFLGNPGTGKTTVAKIYGQLLSEMGLLSRGDVIIKCPSDFVGDVLGSSEKQTRDILRSAEGNVLVIDEAYCLYSGSDVTQWNDPYKTAVIDTIVEQVQAQPGDDRAVVLLGYEDEMQRMFKSVNPGLSRRFQLEHAFRFPDYDDASLVRILRSKAKYCSLELSLNVAKQAIASLAKERAKPNFGNAGAVENILSAAKLRLQKRGGGDSLTVEDFGVMPEVDTADTLLSDMVGCEEIQTKLKMLKDMVIFAENRCDDPKEHVCFNYLFLGNPGTGKTTVARRMGKLFKSLGLLPDDTVKEISASDLITGYVGQAGKKTREIFQMSRGGVLFIDEAYQLNPKRGGSYMTEVVDELVKALTSPEFFGKILVILAGYQKDMDDMLSTNPGLKSRFAESISFKDMNAMAVADLMMAKMKSRNLPLHDGNRAGLLELSGRLTQMPEFANGRDVETWSQITYQVVSSSKSQATVLPKRGNLHKECRVTLNDMTEALDQLLERRSFKPSTVLEPPPKVESGQQSYYFSEAKTEAQIDSKAIIPQTSLNIEKKEAEQQHMTDEIMHETENDDQFNPFMGIATSVLSKIQVFLDAHGLNTAEGAAKLSSLLPSDPMFIELVSKLVSELGMTPLEAHEQLLRWQDAQEDLQKELERMKEKMLGSTMKAIWRCAVCGRANKPWIACFVAPYITHYEKVVAPYPEWLGTLGWSSSCA